MSGPFDRSYELKTNDPDRRTLKLSVSGTVKPVPAFVKRISNAEISTSAELGPFLVWPSAHPVVPVEPGERLSISLRLRPKVPGQNLQLEFVGELAPFGPKLRHEESGFGYWLDVPINARDQSFSQTVLMTILTNPSQRFDLTLDVNVQTDTIIATPRELNLKPMSLAELDGRQVARLGIRKTVGSMRLKSVASTLPFLRLEQQTIVEGSNYLVRVYVDAGRATKAGSYKGSITAVTEDGKSIQVPVAITLTAN